MTFEKDLLALFDGVEDIAYVDDTIWYSPIETLYEAIIRIHNDSVIRGD